MEDGVGGAGSKQQCKPEALHSADLLCCGDRFCGASQAALRRSNDLMQSLRVSFWFEVQDAEQAFSIT